MRKGVTSGSEIWYLEDRNRNDLWIEKSRHELAIPGHAMSEGGCLAQSKPSQWKFSKG